VPTPWTFAFRASVRPTVRHFQARLSVLEAIEASGRLASFRVTDDAIEARTKPAEELTLSSSEVRVLSFTGPDEIRRLAGVVAEEVEPPVQALNGTFQYVLPLPTGYDEARQIAAETLLGDWVLQKGAADWAMIIDGVHHDTTYQAEFGIVAEQEIVPRIERTVGRQQALGRQKSTPSYLRNRKLPQVAIFVDAHWFVGSLGSEEGRLAAALERWTAMLSDSNDLVSQIGHRLGSSE
jgi:hypothetical protein